MKLFSFSFSIGLFVLAHAAVAATPMGTYYQVAVTDPPSLISALDKYTESPTGQKNPAQITLWQIMSNGTNPATHAISVAFASAEDMDKSRALNQGSEDLRQMQASMASVMTPVSESMFRDIGITAGSSEAITAEFPVGRFILLDVEDPAAYVVAWEKMMATRDSDLPSSLSQIVGAGPADTTHVVGIYANNMTELMALMDANIDNPDWAEFLTNVDGIRTVEEDSIVVRIKSWGN